MNAHLEWAKDHLQKLDGNVRADTAQSLATVVLAGAVIALAEIIEEGLTQRT